MSVQRTIKFQAWRIPPGGPPYGYPLKVVDAINLDEAVAFACAQNFVVHKDHLLIQRVDHARGRHYAYLFRIVQTKRFWNGREYVAPLEPREVARWPLAEPIKMLEPPSMADVIANPVGIDRNIIEGAR